MTPPKKRLTRKQALVEIGLLEERIHELEAYRGQRMWVVPVLACYRMNVFVKAASRTEARFLASVPSCWEYTQPDSTSDPERIIFTGEIRKEID